MRTAFGFGQEKAALTAQAGAIEDQNSETFMSVAARSRSGGRAGRRALRTAPDHDMLPGLTRKLPLCEPLDEDQILRLDDASMSILEEVGIIFRDPIALDDWKKTGAKVDGERVYLDREHVRELISSIPSSFTYHARNPKKNVPIGGNRTIFRTNDRCAVPAGP